jgi:hypothetical protein
VVYGCPEKILDIFLFVIIQVLVQNYEFYLLQGLSLGTAGSYDFQKSRLILNNHENGLMIKGGDIACPLPLPTPALFR